MDELMSSITERRKGRKSSNYRFSFKKIDKISNNLKVVAAMSSKNAEVVYEGTFIYKI